MKTKLILAAVVACALMVGGCTSKVDTTEDSTKVEVEVPKVEIGDKPVDLDPRTDDDVDVDTPAPGDK